MSRALGKHWFNNGQKEGYFFECPDGWVKGRLPVSEETKQKQRKNTAVKNLSDEKKRERIEKIKETKRNKSTEEKRLYSLHLSEARKGKNKGQIPWNKGKKGVQQAWNKGLKLPKTKDQIEHMKQARAETMLKNNTHYGTPGKKAWNKGLNPKITENELIEKCLSIEFPQTQLTEASLRRNFNTLVLSEDLSKYSNCCCQLIQHFHPSLWKANRFGFKSPYSAWYDVNLIEKAVYNRFKYKGENLSPKDIRSAFTIAKLAPKVSVFRPSLAKYIYKKYLNDFDEIFDPCSGYSGRLLGAAVLGKKYVGQDINNVTVKESKNLISYFNLENIEVSCKNSLNTCGNYQSLFTCPPYNNKENWNQSIEDLSCDEWIDTCLQNYVCKRYVFVVDETLKYKEYIKEELENRSHLSRSKEYIIVIDR